MSAPDGVRQYGFVASSVEGNEVAGRRRENKNLRAATEETGDEIKKTNSQTSLTASSIAFRAASGSVCLTTGIKKRSQDGGKKRGFAKSTALRLGPPPKPLSN